MELFKNEDELREYILKETPLCVLRTHGYKMMGLDYLDEDVLSKLLGDLNSRKAVKSLTKEERRKPKKIQEIMDKYHPEKKRELCSCF